MASNSQERQSSDRASSIRQLRLDLQCGNRQGQDMYSNLMAKGKECDLLCGDGSELTFPGGPKAKVNTDSSKSDQNRDDGMVTLKSYSMREQHPFYRTSSNDLGLKPSACHLPVRYFPRDNSFTLSVQGIGNYMDSHFTTELDHCKHVEL